MKSLDLDFNYNFNKLKIFTKLTNKNYDDLTIAIKTPNPVSDKRWGDYFYALSLKRVFKRWDLK